MFYTIDLLDFNTCPRLGMGTWHMGDNRGYRQEEITALQTGIEHGLRIIDTAEMYGNGASEELVGQAIHPFKREDLFIVSKVLPNYANAQHMPDHLHASLNRLGTDYLDLYLYHWRGNTPLAETVATLNQLKEQGKIRAWGVSNFDLDDMQDLAKVPHGEDCLVNQVLYHLGSRGIEYELLPYMAEQHILPMAYCPLAQAGRLRQEIVSHPTVHQIAAEMNLSVYQVLLLFVLTQPQMIAIPKAGTVKNQLANLQVLNAQLSADQIERLNQVFPAPNYPTPLDVE